MESKLVARDQSVLDRAYFEEVCTCGTLRSKHTDVHPQYGRGHGPNPESGCFKYTWDGHSGPLAPKRDN